MVYYYFYIEWVQQVWSIHTKRTEDALLIWINFHVLYYYYAHYWTVFFVCFRIQTRRVCMDKSLYITCCEPSAFIISSFFPYIFTIISKKLYSIQQHSSIVVWNLAEKWKYLRTSRLLLRRCYKMKKTGSMIYKLQRHYLLCILCRALYIHGENTMLSIVFVLQSESRHMFSFVIIKEEHYHHHYRHHHQQQHLQ